MKKKIKVKKSILHVKNRALERYGLELTKSNHEQLSMMIKHQQGKFIKKLSNRVTIWECILNEIPLWCYYNKNIHKIVTVVENPHNNKENNDLSGDDSNTINKQNQKEYNPEEKC